MSIGDGGNEVGMGKVYEQLIASDIPNAKEIGCVTATDHLITASVSNWGGYALATAIAVLSVNQFNNNITEALNECLPSDELETVMCQRMIDAGARDGITGKNELFIDGMPLQTSLDVLNELKQMALRLSL